MEDLVDREIQVSNEKGQEFLDSLFEEILSKECPNPKKTLFAQLAGLGELFHHYGEIDHREQIFILFQEVFWYFSNN